MYYDFMFDFSKTSKEYNEIYKKYCEKIFDLMIKRKQYINDYLHKISIENNETQCYSIGKNDINYFYNLIPKEEDMKYVFNLDIDTKKFSDLYYYLKTKVDVDNYIYMRFNKNDICRDKIFLTYTSFYGKRDKLGYLHIDFYYGGKKCEESYVYLYFFVKENENNILKLDIEKTKRIFDICYKCFQELCIKNEKEAEREKEENEILDVIHDKITKTLTEILTNEEIERMKRYYGKSYANYNKSDIIDEMIGRIFNPDLN